MGNAISCLNFELRTHQVGPFVQRFTKVGDPAGLRVKSSHSMFMHAELVSKDVFSKAKEAVILKAVGMLPRIWGIPTREILPIATIEHGEREDVKGRLKGIKAILETQEV
jgi:hypothetical protein